MKIIKYYIHSPTKGYVIWKDNNGTMFQVIDLKDLSREGGLHKIREFNKFELKQSLRSYRIDTPDAKAQVVTIHLQTIEDSEIDD